MQSHNHFPQSYRREQKGNKKKIKGTKIEIIKLK